MKPTLGTSLRRSVVGLAALALLPALALPATAAERTVEDPVGDMWKIEEGSTEPARAPRARIGDFVRAKFKHTDERVVARARFVELERTGKRLRVWVEMRDEHGTKTYLGFDATRRDRNGEAWLMSSRGRDIACNVRHRIDYRDNLLRLSFRRGCLDEPRYLQFRALSEHTRRVWSYVYLDNPLSRRAVARTWTGKVRSG